MKLSNLITQLRSLDIKLWVEGDRLGYAAPPGALTDKLRVEIIKQKNEIIEFLRSDPKTNYFDLTPIEIIPRDHEIPLSFAQQRLWFLHQLDPGNPSYNMITAVRLNGILDISSLQNSLNEIVCRHETLRTVFPTVKGQPKQQIMQPHSFELAKEDLSSLPAGQREFVARDQAKREAMRPFDLARGPLVRGRLLQLDDHMHILVLCMHHIVSDGWSLGVLFHELAVLYESYTTGLPSPLPELPVQYADFAVWQRQWLRGQVLDSQLSYWREKLTGEIPVLNLPTDYPRPAIQTFNGARHSIELSRELSESLKELSRNERVTLFMTLLSAFKVLLYRYTGQEDIIIGSPVANRNRAEIEDLIGFFVNMLVFRSRVSGTQSFLDLLAQVRETCLEGYIHQDLPFEQLVDEFVKDRDLSRSPLFQVTFALQNAPMEPLELSGLQLEQIKTDSQTTHFDLEVHVWEQSRDLKIIFVYNRDLFVPFTIERMMNHYQELLQGIVSNPEQRISELPLMDQKERWELLEVWGRRQSDYPRDASVHELFESQVRETPDAVAIVFKDKELTYNQLNERANRLANYLRAIGIRRGSLVAVCLERSIEMVVSMLGVLKAGGAYVPLDLSYPVQRLYFMLQDTGSNVLITLEDLSNRFSEGSFQVVCLDRDKDLIYTQPVSDPKTKVCGDNLAYVMYTSGSTGTPKGVEVLHRGIVRLVCNTDYIQLGDADRVGHISNCSFDASTFEIWGALLSGARLVVLDRETVLSPRMLAGSLKSQDVNFLFLTTALFNLLAKDSPHVLAGIGHLLFGGETADPQWVRRVLNEKGTGRLIHVYGPTENTTFTTWHEVTSLPDEAMTVPIGRPIANTQVYVLDSNMEPVPVGVPGELYIGGDGLARGYLNRPELTSEKFVPDPFIEKPDTEGPVSRLYCTGDTVRWLPEGVLEFLGRKDDQVKLRGFRIELGEIKSVLCAHDAVGEAAVLLHEDEPGKKRLVGYMVPGGNGPISMTGEEKPSSMTGEKGQVSIDNLRAFLKKRLPDYMVPSCFVQLESLPLTPNGKVDKQALPVPDQSFLSGDKSGQIVGPRTPTEQALVEIWSDVLGRSGELVKNGIGIHDNFFHLGGHSLMATQVISRVNETFGVSLPVTAMFEHPTPCEFARELESRIRQKGLQQAKQVESTECCEETPLSSARQSLRQEGLQQALQIKPIGRKEEMPLSFAQQRLWFISQLEPDSPSYNMPMAFRLTGKLEKHALQYSLNVLVRRHESLRTIFPSVEGRPRQCIMEPKSFKLEQEDLRPLPSELRESEAGKKIEREALQPFDLAEGPLVRGLLLQIEEDIHIMVLCMHHIISDGWSMRLFFNELATIYTAFSSGQPPLLQDLTIQYADFAYWQRNRLQGQFLQLELDYWKKQLGDNPPPLEFPADRPRPAIQTYKGAFENIRIDGPLLENLCELTHCEEATLFMTMLAAFKVILYRYTGQKDILIGIPIAGRNRQEIEGLIGFFVNTLVLRTDLSGHPTFRSLMKRVRHIALEAYQHQEVPFEKLVEELHPKRDLSRNPIFQIFFNMVDLNKTKIKLPYLEAEPMPLPLNIAKFDMTVYCYDHGDALSLSINYSTDLFQAGTIKRLLGHYKTLLTSVAKDPDHSISVAPLFSEKERTKLKNSCNEISPPNQFQEFKRIEIEQTITERFFEQAKKYPERIAIKTTNEQWTYGHLDMETCRIAHAVNSKISKDCRNVALLFGHDAFIPAAMLAVLKTGRAYVPLDITYPRARLEYIIKDSMSGAIITNAECIDMANTLSKGMIPLINVDKMEDNICPDAPSAKPYSLAYILYTSGSTGQPKGVMQNHRNVLHHIRVYSNTLHIVPEDRLTFLTSYTFDGAVMDIYGALLNGATLYPYNIRQRGLAALPSWLDSEQVTIYHSTPSVYRYFIGMLDKDQVLCHMRLVVLGGEEVLRKDIELYKRHFADHSLFVNGLGPSESTLALQYFMNHNSIIDHPSVPAGYPVADTEVILIGEEGEEVDLYGEIGIRSAHVALGYWQRPELTQKVFLPDEANASNRIYRTGDMGRMLSNGSIEFAGRKDFQVKIRGMRIELGEINTVLTQHPSVQQAITITSDDGMNGKQLVSYVIPSGSNKPSSKDLRNFLRQHLADYMIPAAFMILKTIPLTPNGKIDYRALPEPLQTESGTDYAAPRNNTERQLSEIWTDLLQMEYVGINDNFFQLGGQSLLATQVMARIQKVFGVELPLRNIFQSPTIAGLAKTIEEARIADPARRIPSIGSVSRESHRIYLPLKKPRENHKASKITLNKGGEE